MRMVLLRLISLAAIALAPQAAASADKTDIRYFLSTKMYFEADGTVNLGRYEGYGLAYEDASASVELSGTIYRATPKASARDVAALRVWDLTADTPRLATLCCTPELVAEQVAVLRWDEAVRAIAFHDAAGRPAYREVKQGWKDGISVRAILGVADGHAKAETARSIAISSERTVTRAELRAFLCEKRTELGLGVPNYAQIPDTPVSRRLVAELRTLGSDCSASVSAPEGA